MMALWAIVLLVLTIMFAAVADRAYMTGGAEGLLLFCSGYPITVGMWCVSRQLGRLVPQQNRPNGPSCSIPDLPKEQP